MSLQTPSTDKALMRVGLGTQTAYDALSSYTPGGLYYAMQDKVSDHKYIKLYVAQSASDAYALVTDYADEAGAWRTGRAFTIKDNSEAHAGTAVTVKGDSAVTLKLPATITANIIGAVTGKADTAGTADKLAVGDKGSATVPVYFDNGVPVACTSLSLDTTGSAAKLSTSRTFSLTGLATGSGVFDGSANCSINVTSITASGTNQPLILQYGTGTTEDTDVYTFNGASEKTVQLVADGNYINLTTAAGKITLGPGASLTSLQSDVDTIRANYVNKTNHAKDVQGAKDYAKTYADGIYDKIAGGQLPAAFDTLKEIVDYLDGEDGSAADAVLTKIDNKANKDGSNVGSSSAFATWNYLNIGGSAAKWTTARTFTISGTASASAAKGESVDGSGNVTLLLPQTLSGLTSVTSTTFTGNLIGTASKASALVVSKAIGGTTVPVYIDANGVPQVCTSISLTASKANQWATARTFKIEDSASTPHAGTGASVDGTGNVTLKLPTTITATLNGTADAAKKLVKSDGTDYAIGTATRPIYFAGGVPVACSDSLDVDITGNAATASEATHASKADNATNATKATSAGKWTNAMNVTVGASTKSFNYDNAGITFAATEIGSTVIWETF